MRKWIGLIAAVAGVLVLALLAVTMGRGIVALLNGGGSGGEADPMFAEPAEQVTRPPELSEEAAMGQDAQDPSAGWVYEETSPVDSTPDQLELEVPAV